MNKHKTPLYFWIRKLKDDNVTPKTIKIDVCDESNWRDVERQYIQQLRKSNKLLNLSDGGEGIEDKSRWIKTFQYDYQGNLIKTYSSIANAAREMNVTANSIHAALNQKFSKSSCGYYWFTSKKLVKNFIFKRPRQRYMPVLAYDLNGKFFKKYQTIKEASLAFKIHKPNIIRSLSSNGKHYAGNLFWFYEDNVPNKVQQFNNNKPRKHNLSAVSQFTKEGLFIQDYISIKNATEITKVSEDSIGMCARKRAKTGGGFIWKYKNK